MAQNTLTLFVDQDFGIEKDPHRQDPRNRWRTALGFSTFSELLSKAKNFVAGTTGEDGETRGRLGALAIIGHGAQGELFSKTKKELVLNNGRVEAWDTELSPLLAPGGDVVVYGCTFGGERRGTTVMKTMARVWPSCWIIGFPVLTVVRGNGLPDFYCTNTTNEEYAQFGLNESTRNVKPDPMRPPMTSELRKSWMKMAADEFSPYAKIVWNDKTAAKGGAVVHWPLLPAETALSRPGDWFERPEWDD